MVATIIAAIIGIVTSNLLFDFLFNREKNMSTSVTLDEFLNNDRSIIRQVVYKVDGDHVGDIKGDNVTVILMGNGDFNGNIDSNNGNVVLIKGSINGDVKADKIVCPTKPTTDDKDQYIYKEEHGDTPPEERIEYVHNCKLATKYITCPIVHIKCPNCGKHFSKQLRVQTRILDGVIVGTNVEEMRHDY